MKNARIVSDLEQEFYRKIILSYGGLLKQENKILSLDDTEDGDLVKTSDDEMATDEEKAHSITTI